MNRSGKVIASLIIVVTVCSVVVSGQSKDSHKTRPNILFIIADDLGARLGCYGDELAQTPELDQLGKQGVVFRNCFTQFATCGPSRASMLSGLYPYQTGITNNKKHISDSKIPCTSLPRLFRENGYYTARVGKVFHMGIPGGIGEAGLDDEKAWDIAINNTGWDAVPQNYENANHHGERGFGTRIVWDDPDLPNKEMADGKGTLEALRLMSDKHPDNTGKPLMLFMGYYRPHPPMISPRSSWEAINSDKIILPKVPDGDRDDIPEINFHLTEDDFNFIPEPAGRSYTHAYYAAINFVDTEVGKLLKGLKDNGLDQNTIVVFTGDQGFHLGEHGHWHKSTFFEEASRVPLIIADLRNPSNGEQSTALCGLVDLYPTICEFAEIDPVHEHSGLSLVPNIADPGLPVRESVLTQGNPGGASIRTERYRYTEWDGGKKGAMLYDLKTDPHEFTNLVSDPEYKRTATRLKYALDKLLSKNVSNP